MTLQSEVAATSVTPDHIRSVFEAYARSMTAGDVEGIVALYAPDATLEDPVGTTPQSGREAIRKWYSSAFAGVGGGIEMVLEGAVRIAGSQGAAAMLARTRRSQQPITIETLDVMEFNSEGLVTSMRAYWGPTNIKPLT